MRPSMLNVSLNQCQHGTCLAQAPGLISSTNAQKISFVLRERIWVDLACLQMEEKVYLE